MGWSPWSPSRLELLEALRERYREASRREKGRILDEFVAVANCHRKHAVRLLGRTGEESTGSTMAPGRICGEATEGGGTGPDPNAVAIATRAALLQINRHNQFRARFIIAEQASSPESAAHQRLALLRNPLSPQP